MIVVCAPDSYKESMTAPEAAQAMADGVRDAVPDAVVIQLPMSDGGEGFVAAIAAATGDTWVPVEVLDALGRPIEVGYAWLPSTCRAVIEMASAAGLEAIAPDQREVRRSSTVGVGRLVHAALDAGARHLVIGLGGSATDDAGAGLLVELGVVFRDPDAAELAPVPAEFERCATIDVGRLDPRLADCLIEAACDVTNALLGPTGASAVYGPQKGASPDDVAYLDDVLAHLVSLSPPAAKLAAVLPGAGAAGGLGWALLGFLGARMRHGVDLVADTIGLDAAVAVADLVLTGEGSVDGQTLRGKTPAGVAAVARRHGVHVIVFGGRVTADAAAFDSDVVDLVTITPEGQPLEAALRRGPENLRRAVAAGISRYLD
ncbi:MAG TPA: glycerate kinase [Cellulomonadaceae bacterium]|nr:glycerate kinase [Cellulomonadaceae bacterium]